uniref:Uncharacterized protein n=1 Tax=Arundo donax TaxID=35708 RepID=A0A0A9DCM9_ARUDO
MTNFPFLSAFAARYSGYDTLKKGACASSQHQELERKFHEQGQPLDPIHNHQSDPMIVHKGSGLHNPKETPNSSYMSTWPISSVLKISIFREHV